MNNYLLQTDNYGPLVDLIDRLHRHISDNDALISRILRTADTVGQPLAKHDSSDELRYFLDSKYHLNSMPDLAVDEAVGVPQYHRQLLQDIYKLTAISSRNQAVNRQLFEIIKTYEIFITTSVIPQLRTDSERIVRRELQDLKRVCEFKHTTGVMVYEKYQIYVEYLEKLRRMFGQLLALLEGLETREIGEIEKRLVAIDELVGVARTTAGTTPRTTLAPEFT